MAFKLGTVTAAPGRIRYGTWDLVAHPVGGADHLPVILAQGDPKGPVFWLTAGIHGPEHAGLQVIHRLIDRALARELCGTLVALPALNPAGLRTMQRQAHYHHGDPNRLFPDGKPPGEPDLDDDPPSALENAYGRLFAAIQDNGHFMVDLHNAWIGSVSFVFRDRVFYRNDGPAARRKQARAEAQALDRRLGEMCAAYGHSVVNELPVKRYLARKLHRSTTAAAVNVARIPALTMELGTGEVPDPAMVRAAVAGLRNILRWAGMLGGDYEAIEGIRIVDPGFPCRRREAPRVSRACLVHHLREPGDLIRVGDPLAEVRDIWGRPVGEKVLRSEYDGWIMGRSDGVLFYPGEAVYGLAIRDDLPTVQAYPREFFKD
jgi:predicted deacylase